MSPSGLGTTRPGAATIITVVLRGGGDGSLRAGVCQAKRREVWRGSEGEPGREGPSESRDGVTRVAERL
eukprot:6206512-Pleurochrysis_carterae.AAC.2